MKYHNFDTLIKIKQNKSNKDDNEFNMLRHIKIWKVVVFNILVNIFFLFLKDFQLSFTLHICLALVHYWSLLNLFKFTKFLKIVERNTKILSFSYSKLKLTQFLYAGIIAFITVFVHSVQILTYHRSTNDMTYNVVYTLVVSIISINCNHYNFQIKKLTKENLFLAQILQQYDIDIILIENNQIFNNKNNIFIEESQILEDKFLLDLMNKPYPTNLSIQSKTIDRNNSNHFIEQVINSTILEYIGTYLFKNSIIELHGRQNKSSSEYDMLIKDKSWVYLKELNRINSLRIAKYMHDFKSPIFLINDIVNRIINNLINYDSEQLKENNQSLSAIVQYMSELIDKDNQFAITENQFSTKFNKNYSSNCMSSLERVNLRKMIKSIEVFFLTKLKFSSNCDLIAFNVVIDKKLPEHIITNELNLKQVIHNLLSNSFKYTHNGKIQLKLCKTEENKLKIEVSDTGIGMKEDEIKNLAIPYQFSKIIDGTSEEIKHSNKGSGLGLSIIIDILKSLNTELDIKSFYKKGSKFSFVLDCFEYQESTNVFNKTFIHKSSSFLNDYENLNIKVLSSSFNLDKEYLDVKHKTEENEVKDNKAIYSNMKGSELTFKKYSKQNVNSYKGQFESLKPTKKYKSSQNLKDVINNNNKLYFTPHLQNIIFDEKKVINHPSNNSGRIDISIESNASDSDSTASFYGVILQTDFIPNYCKENGINLINEGEESNCNNMIATSIKEDKLSICDNDKCSFLERKDQDESFLILIIEDERFVANAIQRIIQNYSDKNKIKIKAVHSYNPIEGINVIYQYMTTYSQYFDLIFLDDQMPFMSGIEFAILYKKSFEKNVFYEVNMIMISGGNDSYIDLNSNITHYIKKPLKYSDFEGIMFDLLKRSSCHESI